MLARRKPDSLLRKRFQDTAFRGIPSHICNWLTQLQMTYPHLLHALVDETHPNHHTMEYRHGKLLRIPDVDAALSKATQRFVAWVIVFQTAEDFHGNLIFADMQAKTLWRFEPRGTVTNDPQMNHTLTSFAKQFGLLYQEPGCYQDEIGPQSVEVRNVNGVRAYLPKSGPCVIWALLFLHIKLEYPDMSVAEIHDCMMRHSPIVTQLIQAYGHLIDASRM